MNLPVLYLQKAPLEDPCNEPNWLLRVREIKKRKLRICKTKILAVPNSFVVNCLRSIIPFRKFPNGKNLWGKGASF